MFAQMNGPGPRPNECPEPDEGQESQLLSRARARGGDAARPVHQTARIVARGEAMRRVDHEPAGQESSFFVLSRCRRSQKVTGYRPLRMVTRVRPQVPGIIRLRFQIAKPSGVGLY